VNYPGKDTIPSGWMLSVSTKLISLNEDSKYCEWEIYTQRLLKLYFSLALKLIIVCRRFN